MNPFLAMLLSIRIGFVPTASTAALSIREEVLAVAQQVAERDTFVQRQPVRRREGLEAGLAGIAAAPEQSDMQAAANPWGPPPKFRIRKEQVRSVIERTLQGNQTLANAAVWLASAPLRLRVDPPKKVVVGISFQLP